MKLSSSKLFIGIAVVMVICIFIMASHHGSSTSTNTSARGVQTENASGDTNEEVIKTFAKELADVKDENAKLLQEMKTLEASPGGSSAKAVETLENQIKKNKRLIQSLSHQATKQPTEKKLSASEDYLVNDVKVGEVIHTIDDISVSMEDTAGPVLRHPRVHQEIKPSEKEAQKTVEPYYSIPPGTNAVHTTLLTSLLGEVPNNGSFQQPPFPFQAIIGRKDLLAANGKKLPPEIGGMKISGYAVGVGSFLDNLSCTRAYITQAVYIFNDGHFSVVGNAQDPQSSINNPSNSLGYLSDPWGNTCIPGKYITNAPQVLSALAATGVVSGFGSAIASAQTTTYTGSEDSSAVMDGSTVKYGLGNGLSYGMNKASSWMLERLKGSFDVVYIPASKDNKPTQVVANFTQTIPIDLDSAGRQLRYEHNTLYQVQATHLD